jgi:2,5-diketo-D-gluconate reductase B
MDVISVKNMTVPALGFGTWALSGNAAYQAIRMVLELGYRHFDTAQIYGNETEIGRAIRDSGLPRGEIFLTTKVAPSNLRRADVRRSHEESLKRLGLDQVDLLLVHWPNASIPLGETLEALMALRDAGKTRAIGVSISPCRCCARRSNATAPTSSAIRLNTTPSCRNGRCARPCGTTG